MKAVNNLIVMTAKTEKLTTIIIPLLRIDCRIRLQQQNIHSSGYIATETLAGEFKI